MTHDPSGVRPFRVGLISDTHVPRRAKVIPDWVFQAFDGVDLILHAGDLTSMAVLDELARVAPVEAVAGNVDVMGGGESADLPRRRVIDAGGVPIGLIHGDEGPGRSTPERARLAFQARVAPMGTEARGADRSRGHEVAPVPRAVVFGHSHQPFNEWVAGILMFNPGSATDARTAGEPSVGILTIRPDRDPPVAGEHIYRPRRLW